MFKSQGYKDSLLRAWQESNKEQQYLIKKAFVTGSVNAKKFSKSGLNDRKITKEDIKSYLLSNQQKIKTGLEDNLST